MSKSVDPCAICYNDFVIPVTIAGCGHRFCFLCLKGACDGQPAPLCPICRGAIDRNMFAHPSMGGITLTMKAPESPAPPKKEVKKIKTEDGKEIKVEVKEEPADDDGKKDDEPAKDVKYWLYSGGNGWWRYDPRDEVDIEKAFDEGRGKVDLVMCGHPYTLDFGTMKQFRRDFNGRKRGICRVTEQEMAGLNVKGVCGMRIG